MTPALVTKLGIGVMLLWISLHLILLVKTMWAMRQVTKQADRDCPEWRKHYGGPM